MSSGIPATIEDIPTGIKCVKVYIPDGTDVHLYALRGQLSNLAQRWFWDTGGDLATAEAIATKWLEASEATDLTIACEDCASIIEEYENMEINVTCNCCSSGTPSTLVCYDVDGNPTITPQPIEDDPIPPGGSWPIDTETTDPPGEYETWEEWDAEACAVSNSVYTLLVGLLTTVEGVVDSLTTLAAGIVLFVGLLPAGVAAALGGASVVEVIRALIDLLVVEELGDWALEARDWVQENQEEIVCLIYTNRHNLPGMRNEFANRLVLAVTAVLTLTETEQEQLRNLARRFMPISLLFSWFYEAGARMNAENPIDCSNCGSSLLFADDFTVDHEIDSSWWIGDRASVLAGAMNFNARDISAASLRQDATQYNNYGVPNGLYTDVSMTFKTRVVERNSGTNNFTMTARDSLEATPIRFTLDVNAQVVGQWEEQSITFPELNVSSLGGGHVLRFAASTNTSRLIVEIDDVVINATAPA